MSTKWRWLDLGNGYSISLEPCKSYVVLYLWEETFKGKDIVGSSRIEVFCNLSWWERFRGKTWTSKINAAIETLTKQVEKAEQSRVKREAVEQNVEHMLDQFLNNILKSDK